MVTKLSFYPVVITTAHELMNTNVMAIETLAPQVAFVAHAARRNLGEIHFGDCVLFRLPIWIKGDAFQFVFIFTIKPVDFISASTIWVFSIFKMVFSCHDVRLPHATNFGIVFIR